jgi:hypothetical protein
MDKEEKTHSRNRLVARYSMYYVKSTNLVGTMSYQKAFSLVYLYLGHISKLFCDYIFN